MKAFYATAIGHAKPVIEAIQRIVALNAVKSDIRFALDLDALMDPG